MYFNPRVWRPIAIVLSLSGAGLAAWIRRLGESARESAGDSIGASEQQAQLEGLESDIDQLRRELTETQERLDFAERMLAQKR